MTNEPKHMWRVHGKPPSESFTVRADRAEQSERAVVFFVDATDGPLLVASFPFGQYGRVELIDADGEATNVVETEAENGPEPDTTKAKPKGKDWAPNTSFFMSLVPNTGSIIEETLFELFATDMPDKAKDARQSFNRIRDLMEKHGYIYVDRYDDEEGKECLISRRET